MASCSGGRLRWYPPIPTIETSTPVRPSRRVGTFAPAGTLYFPFGTLPVGAPPACFAMGHLLATGCSVSTNGSGRSYAAARRDRVRAAAAGDRLLPGGCLVHRRVHHAARPARPSGRVRGQREHRLADRLRGHPGNRARQPSFWRARRPLSDPASPDSRPRRAERREPALRADAPHLTTRPRPSRARSLQSIVRPLSGGLSLAQPAAG